MLFNIFSRFSTFSVVLTLAIVLISLLGRPQDMVHAAVFFVDSTADTVDDNPGDGVCDDGSGNCTLRAAIQEANAGLSPDLINLPARTYILTIAGVGEDAAATGDLDTAGILTIVGAGSETTVIDGDSLDRVFHIQPGASLDISGVTVQNGSINANGGGILNQGILDISNSTISNNEAINGGGGGIYNSGGLLTVSNNLISQNNVTDGSGGGIHSSSGTMTVSGSTITENHVTNGNGGGIHSTSSTTEIADTNVANNSASAGAAAKGGGVSNVRIFNGAVSRLTLTNSQVSDNTADELGGGIYNADMLELNNTIVNRNTTGLIGGGGIYNAGTADLTDCAVSDNLTVGGHGGGIFLRASATITRCTINGNKAFSGGGIETATSFGSLTLTNSTISGNDAQNGSGGGILIGGFTPSTTNISNSTISGNSSTNGTGGGISVGSFVTAIPVSTIIANNIGADCSGSITSAGYNLDSDGTCNLTDPDDKAGVDPKLGPLQNNGGPTETHALLASSPAIDAGDATACPATDQRGAARVGTCDIGAFEFQGVVPVSCTLIQVPSYAAGTLAIDFTLGASVPTTWNLWAVVIGDAFPTWSVPIPATPPVAVPNISFPLPPVGTIGFLTTLTTADGIICSDWQTVNTGPSTLSAEDTEKELQKLRRSGKGVLDKNKK